MTQKKTEKEPFDEAMKRLETILDDLEGGDLPLERTVEMFESGMELVKLLSRRLEEMETKIRKLVDLGGELALEPFEPLEENDD